MAICYVLRIKSTTMYITASTSKMLKMCIFSLLVYSRRPLSHTISCYAFGSYRNLTEPLDIACGFNLSLNLTWWIQPHFHYSASSLGPSKAGSWLGKGFKTLQLQSCRGGREHWSSAIYRHNLCGISESMAAPSARRCLHIPLSRCSKPVICHALC